MSLKFSHQNTIKIQSKYNQDISKSNIGLAGYNIYKHPKGMQLQLKYNDKNLKKYVIIAKVKIKENIPETISNFIEMYAGRPHELILCYAKFCML